MGDWTYHNWTPDLSKLVEFFFQKLMKYGFITDREEVCYELGVAMLVVSHRLSRASLTNLMTMTLEAELMSLPYQRRKVVVSRIHEIYKEAIKKAKRDE
jgi:hypothetical protein